MKTVHTRTSRLSECMRKSWKMLFLVFCLPLCLAACNDDEDGDSTPFPKGTDLGPGANCYIVPEAGTYYFRPLHVSGMPIGQIASVGWIWTTVDENGQNPGLISDLKYDKEVISFQASGKKGSTLIAGFDANGSLVWTWHIWCTDQPQAVAYENGVEFMDRNLGAVEAGYSPESIGLLYQWGRKDPFISSKSDGEGPGQGFAKANQYSMVNPDYAYVWGAVKEKANLTRALQNPTTFFYDEDGEWLSEVNNDLWGETKTDFDPSPAGWRIASHLEWDFFTKDNLVLDKDKCAYSYTYNGTTSWWPCNGVRDTEGGELVMAKDNLHIWACTVYKMEDPFRPEIVYYFGNRLVASPSLFSASAPGNKAFAQAVRCVRMK